MAPPAGHIDHVCVPCMAATDRGQECCWWAMFEHIHCRKAHMMAADVRHAALWRRSADIQDDPARPDHGDSVHRLCIAAQSRGLCLTLL